MLPFSIALINFLICMVAYLREKTFGVASVFAYGMILIYFIPNLYNYLLFPLFRFTTPISLAWLAGTILVLSHRFKLNGLYDFFDTEYPQAKIVQMASAITILIGFVGGVGAIGYGYILKFPSIGIFSFICLWGSYAYKNRERLGLLWIVFPIQAVLMFLIFYALLWSGFGRLILGQFVTIGFFFGSIFMPFKRFFKIVFILSIPVLIIVGGLLRSEKATVTSALLEGEGIGSMLEPMQYAEFIYRDIGEEQFEALHGQSYVATVLFYIPRRFWEGKPNGFGRDLAEWYWPRNTFEGFTLAGTHIGEAVGNFNRFGLLVGPLVLLLFMRTIRNFLCIPKMDKTLRLPIRILAGVILLATIPDFLWGGTFTSISRAGIGMMVAFPLLVPILKIRIY